MKESTKPAGAFLSLLPLLIFVFTFLGAGIYLNDFYALPSPIAAVIGIIACFILFRSGIEEKVQTLLEGCGDSKILTMCLIYLLAGAFTVVCKATGSVEAIVDLGLQYISINYLYAGVFVVSAFLSFSTGTSVGSIVALVGIVSGFADQTEASLAILSASLLGGAMFGDNLSFISDTTIAATQTQEVEMKDKFRQNFKIALPAALLTIAILLFEGSSLQAGGMGLTKEVDWILILPYLIIISLAVLGWNVFLVLTAGIVTAGIMGVLTADFTLIKLAQLSYEGFTSMTEIFLLSMLVGGLAALVIKEGGLEYITGFTTKAIKGKSAYLGIGGLVGLTNISIANNTVSILVSGTIAKKIAERLSLNRIKVASALDIFACVVQGFLPYGAQILLLLSYGKGQLNYFELVSNTWYIWFLLFGTTLYFSLDSIKVPFFSIKEAVSFQKKSL